MKNKPAKLHRALLLLLAIVLVAAMGGCSFLEGFKLPFGGEDKSSSEDEESLPEEDPEYPLIMAGAELAARPGKVVSLAPSLTEKIYDLRMEDRLVGVSDYCDYPRSAESLRRCGTMLLPDLAAMEELAPHLIITETTLAEEDMTALNDLGIQVAVLPHAGSLDQLCDVYETMAMLMEGQTTGSEIGTAFTAQLRLSMDGLTAAVQPFVEEGGMPALYLRFLDYTVATGDTLENDLLTAIGLRNIAADYTQWSYPDQSAQSDSGRADFMAVRVIFCDERDVTIKDLEQSAYYKGLPAVLKDQYLYIDAGVFERQSMRMLGLLQEMAAYCYPDADFSFDTSIGDESADAGEDEDVQPEQSGEESLESAD